ncbi:MAG: TonB-dependent receptor [Xanthomonadales bacterium]|nr:Vitamin B12 transporter BtuB [Xanthomonadales bacterium]MCC6592238.1 TonB-dependent receptor [Xanthomonadales bacterium]MCE7932582.1 TonB-dependent receptor [Xanthomonadales bacterium PRO6]
MKPPSRRLLAVALSLAAVPPLIAAEPDATPADEVARRATRLDAVQVRAKGTAADLPSALATDVISWQEAVASPIDFQDLIVRLPGVGATGQNGIFETFSIRGSGGNGILVLVGGTPVTAQRRAGVPVAFVEPALLGEINLTRGPATVHFGPGALGGAISIEPRWFDGALVSTGYANSGDEAALTGGFGNEHFSVGVSRHQSNDTRSANGTPLNTSFERDSASLQYRAQLGDFAFDALLLPSRTDDIGKSNSRYPVRNTTYPEDDHTIGRLRLRHENGFELSLHGHEQSLLTYNRRPGSANTYAYVESLDLGGTVQQTFTSGTFSHNLGVEFLGRRDVNGFDARGTLVNRAYSLRDGEEDSWSVFGLSDWRIGDEFALEAGARFSRVKQQQRGASARDSDRAFTLGANWTPAEHSRFSANLSSGYRFATLEERYFTGVTAQGEIVGSPNLYSESSLGLDIGYAWRSGHWAAEVHAWRTRVDDLIQLFAIQPGVNGYTNVADARLHGLEGVLGWTPVASLTLTASMTLVRSKDERTGDPLYGSPPLTGSLEARYDFGDFTLGAFWSHRWRMDRPGFEEVERDAVDVLDLDLGWNVGADWHARIYVRNAFDEDYFATADELSAFAPGRSVGFDLSWALH